MLVEGCDERGEVDKPFQADEIGPPRRLKAPAPQQLGAHLLGTRHRPRAAGAAGLPASTPLSTPPRTGEGGAKDAANGAPKENDGINSALSVAFPGKAKKGCAVEKMVGFLFFGTNHQCLPHASSCY